MKPKKNLIALAALFALLTGANNADARVENELLVYGIEKNAPYVIYTPNFTNLKKNWQNSIWQDIFTDKKLHDFFSSLLEPLKNYNAQNGNNVSSNYNDNYASAFKHIAKILDSFDEEVAMGVNEIDVLGLLTIGKKYGDPDAPEGKLAPMKEIESVLPQVFIIGTTSDQASSLNENIINLVNFINSSYQNLGIKNNAEIIDSNENGIDYRYLRFRYTTKNNKQQSLDLLSWGVIENVAVIGIPKKSALKIMQNIKSGIQNPYEKSRFPLVNVYKNSGKIGKNGDLYIRLDLQETLSKFRNFLTANYNNSQYGEIMTRIFDGLNLSALEQAISVIKFNSENIEIVSNAKLANWDGIWSIFNFSDVKINEQDLNLIEEDAQEFGIANIKLSEVIEGMVTIGAKCSKKTTTEIYNMITGLSGVDLERYIKPSLGDKFIYASYYGDDGETSDESETYSFVLELKDPKTLATVMNSLIKRYGLEQYVETFTAENVEVKQLKNMLKDSDVVPDTISYAFYQNYLVLTFGNKSAISRVLKRLTQQSLEGTKLDDLALLDNLRNMQGNFNSVGFINYGTLLYSVLDELRKAGIAGKGSSQINFNKMPTRAHLEKIFGKAIGGYKISENSLVEEAVIFK